MQRLALWPCFGTGMRGCACFHTSWPVLLSSALPGRQARTGNLPRPPDAALFTTWSEPEVPFGSSRNGWTKRLSAAAVGMAGEAWIPYWRSVFLYARAALVFADHTVSALECPPNKDTSPAFANTHVAPDGRRLNQRLAEHLSRVSEKAADLVWRMANLLERPEASLTAYNPARWRPFCARRIRKAVSYGKIRRLMRWPKRGRRTPQAVPLFSTWREPAAARHA